MSMTKKKIDSTLLTSKNIKEELNKVKYKSKWNSFLKSTIYILIIIAALGTIISTFITPVLQISTDSMIESYHSGDIVLTIKTKNIKKGDVIAFYHGNKIIISRVIGVQSDYIDISDKGVVKVNGSVLKEDYIRYKIE